jgi:hypothetical protein
MDVRLQTAPTSAGIVRVDNNEEEWVIGWSLNNYF